MCGGVNPEVSGLLLYAVREVSGDVSSRGDFL